MKCITYIRKGKSFPKRPRWPKGFRVG